MCGIAGALARRPDERPPARAAELAAAAMVHRGPDGFGFFHAGPVALAHRRLAIIDLSDAGRQPMTNEDGSVAIVVNGEIYNHAELRADLEAKGHRFRSASDSEVVVHLYEEVGARTPEFLRGMFALAVWDARAATLLLARDRFGEKPLFYCERPDGFVFASEIAALVADPRTPTELSLTALDSYLALQYVPAPHTIYAGINKLPAAHLLELRCGGRPVVRRYYSTSFAPALAGIGEEEAARRVRETVEEAVRSRLMSDVPLGAFLSGGIDSSIIVACMARATGRRVKTFSVGFAEGDRIDNELPYARLVAERYRTDHHELVVDPDMVGLLPSIVRHHGEPFADTSAVPTRYLCEMTRRHVTVALSGDAGDEAFGGYRRYVWTHVAGLLGRLPGPLVAATAGALGLVPGGKARWLREYGARLRAGEALQYLRFVCHFSADEKADIYTPELRARFARDATAEVFAEHLAASAGTDTVSRLQDLDLAGYLPDDILTKVDIASALSADDQREAPGARFEAPARIEADQRDRDRAQEEADPAADRLVNVAVALESAPGRVAVGIHEKRALVGRLAGDVHAGPLRDVAEPERLHVVEGEAAEVERADREQRKVVLGVAGQLAVAAELLVQVAAQVRAARACSPSRTAGFSRTSRPR